MYVPLSFLIPSQSISLSTFILRHKNEDHGFSLLFLFLFILTLLSIPADYYPALGLFDSSLAYPHNQDLHTSHTGLFLLPIFCLFISYQESKCIQVWLIHVCSMHALYVIASTLFFFYSHSLIDGYLNDDHPINPHYPQNQQVNVGDVWQMEVDLRSRQREKRTLHWFVRGEQQKAFITGAPDRVQFGVWYSVSFYFPPSLLVSTQVSTRYLHDSVEFVLLEELQQPSVREIEGEEEIEW